MRLPDINHVSPSIYGHEPMAGEPLPPAFKQGEDVVLEVHLKYNGEVIATVDWDLTAVVKKNKYALCAEWEGVLHNGIFEGVDGKTVGCYEIIIPSSVTAELKMGTYWLDLKGQQKLGRGDGHRDLAVVLMVQPFTIDYAPSSPNPGKALNSQYSEPTYPQGVDIRRA